MEVVVIVSASFLFGLAIMAVVYLVYEIFDL